MPFSCLVLISFLLDTAFASLARLALSRRFCCCSSRLPSPFKLNQTATQRHCHTRTHSALPHRSRQRVRISSLVPIECDHSRHLTRTSRIRRAERIRLSRLLAGRLATRCTQNHSLTHSSPPHATRSCQTTRPRIRSQHAMSTPGASSGAESLRSLLAKLLPLSHPLATKLQLVRTQTARILAAAPPQDLHALVEALCALGDEWSSWWLGCVPLQLLLDVLLIISAGSGARKPPMSRCS